MQQLQALSTKYIDDPFALYKYLTKDKPQNTLLLESSEIGTHRGIQSLLILKASAKIICQNQSVEIHILNDYSTFLLDLLSDYFLSKTMQDKAKNFGKILVEKVSKNTLKIYFFDIFNNVKNSAFDEEYKLKNCPTVLDVLRFLQNLSSNVKDYNLPKDNVFLGGVFGFDLIENFEILPSINNNENNENFCPNYVFYLAEVFVKIDHLQQTTTLYSLNLNNDKTNISNLENVVNKFWDKLNKFDISNIENIENIENVENIENNNNANNAENLSSSIIVNSFPNNQTYGENVEKIKHYIRQGDIFQCVLSRQFKIDCPNSEIAYEYLRKNNPSPYQFFMYDNDFIIFGASPEISVKYTAENRQVELYPIAGTKPRGRDENGNIDYDLDSRIEFDLRQDEKELSEHLMLVDLARNDLARISQNNTRCTQELLKVDKYSHVMHLVSHVTAKLSLDLDCLHAYQACLNMGTLTGAPKIRATEIIRDFEQSRRGSYGGAIGYLKGNGDMDTCILIRSAFVNINNNIAVVQSGGGIVLDSQPQQEIQETINKAKSVLLAIAASQNKTLLFK